MASELLRYVERAAEVASEAWTPMDPDVAVESKALNDFVTTTDQTVEAAVAQYLSSVAPIPIQGEESTPSELAPTRWIIDPIDGTFNHVSSLPLTAFTVCLVRDGEPVASAVMHYATGEIFVAERGVGAFSHGERLTVSAAPVRSAAVSVGSLDAMPEDPWDRTSRLRVLTRATDIAGRVRIFGSTALGLAWAAAGRTAATVSFANNPWDTAAGVLLVREAGGLVIDLHGRPWTLESDSVVAGGPVGVKALAARGHPVARSSTRT